MHSCPEIGPRIKKLRQKIGINSSELARRVGVSPASSGKWESGQSVPVGDNLSKLAFVLATSIDYLTGKTDDPTPVPGNLSQARVLRLSARYGLDPKSMSSLLSEIENPSPAEVYEVMADLREAREALSRAEERMAALFGVRSDGLTGAAASPNLDEPLTGNPFTDGTRMNDALKPFRLSLQDFRSQYGHEVLWAAIREAHRNPDAIDLLLGMTIPKEHNPDSMGKAARTKS